jgi:flagellar protein FliS
MPMSGDPYAKYLKDVVFSATPEDLTLMLYDGALKFCNQGIMAIEGNDTEKAHDMSVRAQNIIRELQLTLKKEYEVSEGLAAMYDYIYRRLIEANITKNAEVLGEARDLIRELRNTWKEAMKLAKQNSAAATAAAKPGAPKTVSG